MGCQRAGREWGQKLSAREYRITLDVTPESHRTGEAYDGIGGSDYATVFILGGDLGVVTTVDGKDGPELSEADEETPGAFVPLNNDNDDYRFNGNNAVIDSEKEDDTPGENDLVAVKIHPIQPVAMGGTFTLTFGGGVKIWRNETKTAAVPADPANPIAVTSGTTEFDATGPTTLYIEGVSKGVSTIALNWKGTPEAGGAAIEAQSIDQVKVTVYEITGPLNVPGYARYTYNAEVPGVAAPGTWTAEGGSATAGAANQCQILWGEGGKDVSYAIFKPNAQFQCKRDVNVVQVELDLAQSKIVIDPTIQPTNINTVGVPHIRSAPKGQVAMTATVVISTLTGPTVNGDIRGVRYIQAGFIQNGKVAQWNAEFGGPPAAISRHTLEAPGVALLDIITEPRSTIPWYDYRPKPRLDNSYQNVILRVSDTPEMNAAAGTTYNGAQLGKNKARLNFNLYLAVRTTESINSADLTYTQRLKGEWHFDGSGDFSTGTWIRQGSNGVDQNFSVVTNGDVVPITAGDVLNDRFDAFPTGTGWSTP